ncbi:hypothetical protein BJ508DRAFT_373111 [Ascobolus immersus RN42]|uniref:BTB domain-containing protein n=1 Tax=Ascobolus immersus RN42 TaxID=1160509 RepID=A0A3N4IP06_ASCIM|nr:hypothetical protein BJ508DRAFT_373111 [Ascobolus immersus RN42]
MGISPASPKRRRLESPEDERQESPELTSDDPPSDCESTISTMTIPDDPLPADPVPLHPPSATFEVKPKQCMDVASSAQKLFLSDLYSDFEIVCGNSIFPAHKFVVCLQSEYFTCLFRSGLKEDRESKIKITDEKPRMIHRLLFFLYYGFYNSCLEDGSGSTQFCTQVNFTMYRLADKYGIPSLTLQAIWSQVDDLNCHNQDEEIRAEEIWSTRKAYRIFTRRNDPMRLLQMNHLAAQFARNGSYWKKVVENVQLREAREEDGQFAVDFMDFWEWNRRFLPAGKKVDGDRKERPRRWERNGQGGWDVFFEWGEPVCWEEANRKMYQPEYAIWASLRK